MPTIGELCTRDVVVVHAGERIVAAAQRMRAYHVGCLVVVEEQAKGRVATGILTDRDIVTAMVATDPTRIASMTVREMRTERLLSATADEDFFEVLVRMRSYGVRRFPVVDHDGVLRGLIALDDLVGFVAEQMGRLSALLQREQRKERDVLTAAGLRPVPQAGEEDVGHLRWR